MGYMGLLGLLVMAALAVKYWWVVVLVILGLMGMYRYGIHTIRARQKAIDRACTEHERAALAARADRQQEQTLAGDPRGEYGDFPPTPL